jgi:hypothetical protein
MTLQQAISHWDGKANPQPISKQSIDTTQTPRQLLALAATKEAASIKARIRHIFKVDAASTHPFLTKSL